MRTPSFAAIAPGNLAVVTDAASGIGLAAPPEFCARGMRVAMLDRPGDALDAAAGAIEGATAYGVDVADAFAIIMTGPPATGNAVSGDEQDRPPPVATS